MKCENCGGNLSLEEAACPHCGTINKHAQQHVRDMNRYQGEFADTQSNVKRIVNNYVGITVRAVIIVVLLILIVIFLGVEQNAYSIKRGWDENKSNRNYEKYSAIMDNYLAEEDFLAFDSFCEGKNIDYYDTSYQEYYQIIRLCRQYQFLYEEIVDVWLRRNEEEMDENDISEWVELISNDLTRFYELMDVEQYMYYEGVDSEENQAVVQAIKENLEVLLQTYCGLTEEETESLKNMSAAKRAVLLEEKIGYGE